MPLGTFCATVPVLAPEPVLPEFPVPELPELPELPEAPELPVLPEPPELLAGVLIAGGELVVELLVDLLEPQALMPPAAMTATSTAAVAVWVLGEFRFLIVRQRNKTPSQLQPQNPGMGQR